MNRRVSIALATAAATALTMVAPAVAEEAPPTTTASAPATAPVTPTEETTAVGTEETTGQPSESSTVGQSADSLSSGSSDSMDTTDPEADPEATTGLDEEGRCPNGEFPEYPVSEDEEEPAKDTFLGPYALFEELTGSSIPGKSTSTPTGADEFGCTKEQQMDPSDYPEWMHSSLFPSENVKMVMAVIEALLIVGMTATQVAAVAVPFVPGAREELRSFLTSLGVNVDA